MTGGRVGRGPRLRPRLAAVAAVTALVAISAAFAPVRATSYGPAVACEPAVATLQTLISLDTYFDGPLATRYGTPALNEGALECLASTELTFVAFRAAPEGQGGVSAYLVQPDWMDTWQQPRWFVAPTDAEIAPGLGAGPFLAVAVPPDLQARFEGLTGQWVSVRGHFDDAAAATCQLTGNPKPIPGEIPTKADLLAMCRTSFVVMGIDPIAVPCPTGAIDWAAISATPEPLRAKCFGRSQLGFVARGFSINNSWNLRLPDLTDWELLDPAGGSDMAAERAKALEAFVPRNVAVPNPSDAPWHNTDGVGGLDVRWRIEGHFDDPGAAGCQPEPEGYVLDGRQVVWSEEDARDFCRNHLIVDGLEWIRDPVPSATAADAPAGMASAAPTGSVVPDAPVLRAPPTSGPALAIAAAVAALATGLVLGAAFVRRRRA
jgi:hypothetical protein